VVPRRARAVDDVPGVEDPRTDHLAVLDAAAFDEAEVVVGAGTGWVGGSDVSRVSLLCRMRKDVLV
jgi:hypothetical protein